MEGKVRSGNEKRGMEGDEIVRGYRMWERNLFQQKETVFKEKNKTLKNMKQC